MKFRGTRWFSQRNVARSLLSDASFLYNDLEKNCQLRRAPTVHSAQTDLCCRLFAVLFTALYANYGSGEMVRREVGSNCTNRTQRLLNIAFDLQVNTSCKNKKYSTKIQGLSRVDLIYMFSKLK